MAKLVNWTPDLSVGIDAIDDQHKRIVDFINQLNEAGLHQDRGTVNRVLEELLEYTVSHFSFEEAMMEQADYEFFGPHKKVHELFARRVAEYRHRFLLGEDVAIEMQSTLIKWLMNHIKREDMSYASAVRAHLNREKPRPAAKPEPRKPGGAIRKLLVRK